MQKLKGCSHYLRTMSELAPFRSKLYCWKILLDKLIANGLIFFHSLAQFGPNGACGVNAVRLADILNDLV